ncbi:glycosyltransferase, partial [Vibrio anguillarum]
QLPKNKFIIGYTGTLGVANALQTLIEAAERLQEYTEIAFVLVGAGKEKAALQSLVAEKQLRNIFFIDPIPKVEIQSILSEFDACYIGLTK